MKMYGEKDVVERREYVKMHRVKTLYELQNNTMEPLGWFSLPGWFKDLVRSEPVSYTHLARGIDVAIS